MGNMHTAFSGLSVSKICPDTCDAKLQPFPSMRAKFFDGIEGGKATSRLETKVYTIYLGNGISVVMKKWKATRLYHLGFSLNIPGNSSATVVGLEAGKTYRYALYQYTSDNSWAGDKSSVSVNGGTAFITKITKTNDPTKTGTFVAGSDGTATFDFTRMGNMHTAFSGLSVSKICPTTVGPTTTATVGPTTTGSGNDVVTTTLGDDMDTTSDVVVVEDAAPTTSPTSPVIAVILASILYNVWGLGF